MYNSFLVVVWLHLIIIDVNKSKVHNNNQLFDDVLSLLALYACA